MSCGDDPASGLQDRCVSLCGRGQEKSVHCRLQPLLPQLWLKDTECRIRQTLKNVKRGEHKLQKKNNKKNISVQTVLI